MIRLEKRFVSRPMCILRCSDLELQQESESLRMARQIAEHGAIAQHPSPEDNYEIGPLFNGSLFRSRRHVFKPSKRFYIESSAITLNLRLRSHRCFHVKPNK